MTGDPAALLDESEPALNAPDITGEELPLPPVMVAGVPCRVRRIRTRELLAVQRVITDGLGADLFHWLAQFTPASDAELAEEATALLVVAAPKAPAAVCEMIRAVVEPA